MPKRLTPAIAAFGLLAAPELHAQQAEDDLLAAFTATYHHTAPFITGVREPLGSWTYPIRSDRPAVVTMSLVPSRLVHLDGPRYALFVLESDQVAGHMRPGAISIAYLDRAAVGWKMDQLWPEIVFMGNGGVPADKVTEADFWREPLILASSTYCGSGACSEDIAIFVLGRNAPRRLGTVPGSADNRGFPDGSCDAYHFTTHISPAASPSAVLSVAYTGWTALTDSSEPKHMFHMKTDFAVSGDELGEVRAVKLPDCGR